MRARLQRACASRTYQLTPGVAPIATDGRKGRCSRPAAAAITAAKQYTSVINAGSVWSCSLPISIMKGAYGSSRPSNARKLPHVVVLSPSDGKSLTVIIKLHHQHSSTYIRIPRSCPRLWPSEEVRVLQSRDASPPMLLIRTHLSAIHRHHTKFSFGGVAKRKKFEHAPL